MENNVIVNGSTPIEGMPVDPAILDGGNTKLGESIGTFSKLKGNRVYWVPEYEMAIQGSCGKFCESCDGSCYVEKSYVRYTNRETGECSVIKGHAKNTYAFYVDIDESFKILDKKLTRKRKKFVYVRIDQSGEMISEREVAGWAWLAERHPETTFYVYTKAFEYVLNMLLAGRIPLTMIILFSVWHEYGIKEYKLVAHLPNVKAFVYCDKNKHPDTGWGTEEYEAHGLIVQTFCPAYDGKGKMNHDMPCEKCQKCMNKLKSCKIIGCWDH